MIGLVLVTHGNLADEFLKALTHVVGPQDQAEAICIGAHDDMNQRRQDILDAVIRTDTGDGVIVVTDMFGGTPSNLAISILNETTCEVIAGANLPMLVKLASARKSCSLLEAVESAQEAARKYISVASRMLDVDPAG